jgi:phage shock protein E
MFEYRRSIMRLLGRTIMALALLGSMAVSLDADDPNPKELEHAKDTLEEVKQRIEEKKAILVDVRELVEWNEGHVRGAKHLPFRALQEKVNEKELKEEFKGRIVYTYCAVGMRSLKAGRILQKLEIDIRPLKQGYEELAKAGFRTEKP